MVEINNLSFGYTKKKILYENFSVSIQAGNIYGLLGKNGAGKTTLLKNIGGLLFPREGSVLVNRLKPSLRKPSFLRTVYYVPEDLYVPSLSAERYLALNSLFYPNFSIVEFHRYLEALELSVSGKLNSLSYGQQKKFIIAFALACNTQLLLMDEPTNGLDIPSKAQFRKLIASVMNDERLILISTHQTRDLENLIDRVLIVDDGQLLLDAPVEEINKKLCFETVSELPKGIPILYSESHLKGISIIRSNLSGVDSHINLEHLFNGVTQNPTLASELLKTN